MVKYVSTLMSASGDDVIDDEGKPVLIERIFATVVDVRASAYAVLPNKDVREVQSTTALSPAHSCNYYRLNRPGTSRLTSSSH